MYKFVANNFKWLVEKLREELSISWDIEAQKYIQNNLLRPLNRLRFIVLDIETTGFKPSGGDEIISVGACAFQGGRIIENDFFDRLVNPHRAIPVHITELTGISDEMVKEGEDILPVLYDLLAFVDDGVVVGHTIGFDLSFINHKLKKETNFIPYYTIDIKTLARILYPYLMDYSLDGLLCYHHIDPIKRHTASGDAYLTALLFEKYMKKLKDMGIKTLYELEQKKQYFQLINF